MLSAGLRWPIPAHLQFPSNTNKHTTYSVVLQGARLYGNHAATWRPIQFCLFSPFQLNASVGIAERNTFVRRMDSAHFKLEQPHVELYLSPSANRDFSTSTTKTLTSLGSLSLFMQSEVFAGWLLNICCLRAKEQQ